MDEPAAKSILIRTPALSGTQLSMLYAEYGSACGILAAGAAAWRAAGLPPRSCEFLAGRAAAEADLKWLNLPQHHLIMLGDRLYPSLLSHLPDAPLGLFVAGDPALLQAPQLAMVGSRNPTPYGRELAESFGKHLSECGLTITSGLAAGIDAASHMGALAGSGLTIGVCGTGLDIIYPRSSRELAQDIMRGGALVSEFPPGTPARKQHFPQRNRIISGLSLGTLVVEATLHSGSLITARLAGEQGREVFALPGSIHNPMAKGCHRLIREGAKLVDCAADILTELGPLAASLRLTAAPNDHNHVDCKAFSQGPLDKDYKILLDALGFEAVSVDQLVMRTGLKADAVASMLLILELEGYLESYPGGRYLRAGP